MKIFTIVLFFSSIAFAFEFSVKLPRSERARAAIIYQANYFLKPNKQISQDVKTFKIRCCDLNYPNLCFRMKNAFTGTPKIRKQFVSKFYLLERNRNLHHAKHPVPESIEAFFRKYKVKDWPNEIVDSEVKKGKRRIFHSNVPLDNIDIRLAQTLVKDDSGKYQVRETEVIVERDVDENYSFFAYDENGKLSPTSVFKGRNLALPNVCLACHYDRDLKKFTPDRG